MQFDILKRSQRAFCAFCVCKQMRVESGEDKLFHCLPSFFYIDRRFLITLALLVPPVCLHVYLSTGCRTLWSVWYLFCETLSSYHSFGSSLFPSCRKVLFLQDKAAGPSAPLRISQWSSNPLNVMLFFFPPCQEHCSKQKLLSLSLLH